jgi:nucleoside-diphosphate-sugar epimerase
MRVLVTGFAGYLGPVIVKRLLDAGHYVVGYDTGWFLPNYAETPVWPDKVRLADIRDIGLWPEKVDAVVHLAGLSNDPMGALDEHLTADLNVVGTLTAVATLPLARHVVVSSCAVYGATTTATEETPVHPLTAYASGKARVDAALHDAISTLTHNVVSLRLGTVFGYSPGHRLDLVVNRMVYDAVNNGCYVRATGNAARPLVHVEDVADAVEFFLTKRPDVIGIVNVVGENVRMHDLARRVAAYAEVDLDLQPPGADQRDYMASGAKLAALGFTPKRTVEGSLPVLFEKTIGLPPGQYQRLPALQRLIASGRLTPDLRTPQRIAA